MVNVAPAKTIVILSHQRSKRFGLKKYSIFELALAWRKQGHTVIELYGISKFVPADLCILHVDLSVVPDSYIGFSNKYPVVINGKITDTRKTQISTNLIFPGDSYNGKVILKSNLNYGGWPERILTANVFTIFLLKILRFIKNPSDRILTQADYKVYGCIDQVPDKHRNNPAYVIEKFIPERSAEFYCVNYYIFFGSYELGRKLYSTNKIVSGDNSVRRHPITTHAEIVKLRHKLGMDYGKIDYCVVDGKVILLDANKTMGSPRGMRPTQQSEFVKLASTKLSEYF